MDRATERGEDFRWNRRRLVRPSDLSELNDVAIFAGRLSGLYPSVTREQIKELMDSGAPFVLLDVREERLYENSRICGAINIPVAAIEYQALGTLKKHDLIVVYGMGAGSMESAVGVDKLNTLAYPRVICYPGGLKDWKAAGWCVEHGAGEEKEAA